MLHVCILFKIAKEEQNDMNSTNFVIWICSNFNILHEVCTFTNDIQKKNKSLFIWSDKIAIRLTIFYK